MVKRMLIDATRPEETRVAVVNGSKLEEFDYETEFRKQLKGNIYLAKVTRVEPSLQAAFVEYGGNRHAFLPFPEIHQDYYRIPVSDRSHDDPHDHDPQPWHADADEEDRSGYEGAISLSAARTDDLISEAFATVGHEDHDQPGETETLSGPVRDEPTDWSNTFRAESHDPFAHDTGEERNERHAEPQDDPQYQSEARQGDYEAAAEEGETVSVEIVGGDEVEEIRHRRRSMMPRYKIQEVIKRRQIMLIQVSKEERGNKGAAITTFLSLPGRYCVLMPNTPRGGGVSRKIANPQDRKRLKDLLDDLDLPQGMSVILRTAGVERSKAEIKRDLDYLMRLWEAIRDLTLRSTAPALVYEEGNLIKRSIRDIYGKDIDELLIAGEHGYRQAKDFMRMLMPSHVRRVQLYREQVPLFFRFQVEGQIDAIHNPVAQLRSGGYVVINQTEALVSIDVNSGRSTRERNIEETAYKTNLEAADEIARQLRLRDMGGLVVIDFIDMEDPRHDGAVERRLKEAMKNDRARIQIGRMSAFGLLELSRQRLHPSLIESNFHTCALCRGTGLVRSPESASFMALRALEEEAIKGKAAEIVFHAPSPVALFILNHQRGVLDSIDQRYATRVIVAADDTLISPDFRIDRVRMHPPGFTAPVFLQPLPPLEEESEPEVVEDEGDEEESGSSGSIHAGGEEAEGGMDRGRRRRRRRGRRARGPGEGPAEAEEGAAMDPFGEQPEADYPPELLQQPAEGAAGSELSRRRRGRRGGRRRSEGYAAAANTDAHDGERIAELQPERPLEPEPEAVPAFVEDRPESVEAMGADVAPTADSSPPKPPRTYETVNPQPESPKRGWWKRLIE